MDWEDQPRTRTKEKSFLHPLFLVNHLIDSETAECRFIADATRYILQSSVGDSDIMTLISKERSINIYTALEVVQYYHFIAESHDSQAECQKASITKSK